MNPYETMLIVPPEPPDARGFGNALFPLTRSEPFKIVYSEVLINMIPPPAASMFKEAFNGVEPEDPVTKGFSLFPYGNLCRMNEKYSA